jgi:multisubunit Na+/H+ antiporter MnhG subunit
MIEYLNGLLIAIPLVPLNDLLVNWAKKDPIKCMGISFIMFGMNLVVILTYGFLMRPEEPTTFILGLLTAILFIMIRKIKKLLK